LEPSIANILGTLPKQGNSNFESQTAAITKIIPRITKLCALGDREFCSVKLGSWVAEQRAYFCLRLKKNEFVQLEGEIWLQLEQLFSPGMQLYLDGVSVTKQKDLVSSMLRASGNVNIRDGPQTKVVYYDQSARFRISHPVLQKKIWH